MKPFKARCSQIGSIMTMPRNKSDLISKTTQSFLEIWIKEQVYNRTKEFSSKYTEKGKECENAAIEYASRMLNVGMIFKNEKQFDNGWITGEPDIILHDMIIDVKNSWDCFTFPLLDTECPNVNYYWQLQGYMALTGKQHAKLVYVLSDTPRHLIDDEIRRQSWKMGFIDIPMEFEMEIINKMTYTELPDSLKFKVFDIPRNDADIQLIYEQVEKCRKYIDSIIVTK